MAERNDKPRRGSKLTPFQQEVYDTANKIRDHKDVVDTVIIGCIYKKPDLLFDTKLSIDDFADNQLKVYFEIASDLVLTEGKNTLDEVTVNVYVDKHPKLRDKYDEYGGWNAIEKVREAEDVNNFDSHVGEQRKWKALLRMAKQGFPVKEAIPDFVHASAEEIYQTYDGKLNDIFANIDSDVKSYDICDGIYELIDTLDEGHMNGLPYHNMELLSNEVGGQMKGCITLLGGLSNAGKSTVARSITIPSILENDERVVIMINEDSFSKWQREMLVWVCNNELNFDIQKQTVRNGNYNPEIKGKLREAAKWLKEHSANNKITIIPFIQYETHKAIKTIRKYAAMGVDYFVLDTFKMDAGKISQNFWMEMQQNMVEIKNAVKSESLNVHILITFQLEKGSSVMRYYTQNNIGIAKNIVDVASTCIMIRDVFEDEYTGGKRALSVTRKHVDGKSTVESLNAGHYYQVFFIVKNQEGAANSFQIVAEHDKSRNVIKEIGITHVPPDF